jgi:hypothetical protein
MVVVEEGTEGGVHKGGGEAEAMVESPPLQHRPLIESKWLNWRTRARRRR